METRAEIFRADFLIAEIEQGGSMGIENMEPFHSGGVSEDFVKDAEFLQDSHAGRLKEKSRADGLAFVRAFEQDNFMALPA